MAEVFSYVYTTQPVNYPKYFGYAGLLIDTTIQPCAYAGFTSAIQSHDYLVINSVEENGPAWKASLHKGDTIIAIQGRSPNMDILNQQLLEKNSGESLQLTMKKGSITKQVMIVLSGKEEKKFTINEMPVKTKLQEAIFTSLQTTKPIDKKE